MKKILYIQSADIDKPNLIITNNDRSRSSDSKFDDAFSDFDTLRRQTKLLYSNGNLSISRTITFNSKKRAYYITGNLMELDTVNRRMAFQFYIQGVNREQVVNELEAMLNSEGYSLSGRDKSTYYEHINKKNRNAVLAYSFSILLLIVLILYTLWKD